jgi:transposase InsO family protein
VPRVWGVSQPSLSRWLLLYEEFGADGLMNGKVKKPGDRRVGSKVPVAVKDEIIRIKKEDPSFGIRKIKNWMFRFRGMKVSTGSIRKTVKAEGLPSAQKPKKKKRSSDRVRRFERALPMQMWQSDITQFTLGPSSMRVYLTAFMDDHSRYIVAWRLMSRQTSNLVMDAFKDGMVRFGKPREVLTDQGRQYFAWRGKSDFEKSLEHEGIKHVVSRAHHPQTLGKCERFWETVMNEFWTRAKPQDLDEARVRLKYFIDHYNHHRPHQGLNGEVPADRFFGIAKEVRAVIEKTVESNSLAMSIGEIPKPPAFLIGQVGDQRIEGFNSEEGSKKTSDEREDEVSGDSDTRSMGSGLGRRSVESARDFTSDDGVLDREAFEKRSDREIGHEASQILADVAASGGRDDGGTSYSASL